MKKVIIAEKPSVARNIADAVGIKKKNKGYMEGDDYIITWVFGHLLQLYDAVDYDVNMKSIRELENERKKAELKNRTIEKARKIKEREISWKLSENL